MSIAPEDFSQFDISEQEKDKLVGEVIRYILFKTEQNSGCPIKREELTQLITGKNYRQRNLPAFVINEAKTKLSSIFGYEMRELQRSRFSTSSHHSRASQSQQSVADAKSYIIISQLPADAYRKYVEDANKSQVTGFTFVVISIIHVAGGKITEENLWHHLRRLGLYENEESHPILGNIKLALEGLVQQRYLQKEKVNGPEGSTLYYELAERALDGALGDRIKEYVTQVTLMRPLLLASSLMSNFYGVFDREDCDLQTVFCSLTPNPAAESPLHDDCIFMRFLFYDCAKRFHLIGSRLVCHILLQDSNV